MISAAAANNWRRSKKWWNSPSDTHSSSRPLGSRYGGLTITRELHIIQISESKTDVINLFVCYLCVTATSRNNAVWSPWYWKNSDSQSSG